jgi:GNAT superfamily N-acetyltransferase
MGVLVARAFDLPRESLRPLVEESLREGFRFLRRLCDEWDTGANRFDSPGEAFFVAWSADDLVGTCGLSRDPYASDPTVGRVRHLYVRSSDRRLGIGRLLASTVVAHARDSFRSLRLRSDSPTAAAFYRALGFEPVLGAAHATHALDLSDECHGQARSPEEH